MFATQPIPVHPFPSAAGHHWDMNSLANTLANTNISNTTNAIQLPRKLSRPAFVEVQDANIADASPDLIDVPKEYIRKGLHAKASLMTQSLHALALPASLPRSYLATHNSLTVSARPSPLYPTHILAIASEPDTLSLHPTHHITLAAHCANLPRLPPSSASPPTLTLPLVPLTLPSPSAFPALHAYLYNPSLTSLLASLLPGVPVPPSLPAALASGPTLHQLSLHLLHTARASSDSPMAALMALTHRTTGLWRNAVAMGVYDPKLWDALDLAWEVLLGAMNLASGKV